MTITPNMALRNGLALGWIMDFSSVDGRWKQMYTALMKNFGQMQPQIT